MLASNGLELPMCQLLTIIHSLEPKSISIAGLFCFNPVITPSPISVCLNPQNACRKLAVINVINIMNLCDHLKTFSYSLDYVTVYD